MKERLQKVLARAGVASRRASEQLISDGRISVNGKVVRRQGVQIEAGVDEIRLDTEVVQVGASVAATKGASGRLEIPSEAVYLLLNKPTGIVSTVRDDQGRPTVIDFIPRVKERVFPVGRLDEDSEGLILLTNDGTLTNLLTHPRYQVPKTYDLRVRGEVTPEEVRQVERGVWLSEGRTGKARLKVRRRGRKITHIVVTLTEGKNRELRRIFARLRHPVLSLRRTSIGPLKVEGLKVGRYRRLRRGEVRDLYAVAHGQRSEQEPKPKPKGGRGRKPGGRRRS
ncbi:MAG: pseudouridine synthase [Planctomycetota bacterium]|jgi:pseudouridine synthase